MRLRHVDMADGVCRIDAQEVQDSMMRREKMRYGR